MKLSALPQHALRLDGRLLFGYLVLGIVAVMAVFADFIAPEDPLAMVTRPLQWPGENANYPLGSDILGRDVMAGIVHGGRTTLAIGITAALISTGLGTLVGVLSGYYGGILDDVLSKVTELFQTVPPLLLVIVLIVIMGSRIEFVVISVGIVSWPPVARLARGEALRLRSHDFVQACSVIGMSDMRTILFHIIPNVLPSVIVAGSVVTATSILIESGVSFLGLGDPGVVTWGSMIGVGRELIRTEWYLTALPGVALVVTLLAINMVTEVVSDRLNPRAQRVVWGR